MTEKKEPEIFVGSAKRKRKLPLSQVPRRTRIAVAGAILFVALISGGFLIWRSSVKSEERKSEERKYDYAISEARKSASQGNYTKANILLTDFMKSNPKNKTRRYTAEISLAQYHAVTRDYSKAKEWGEKAVSDNSDPDFILYEVMAGVMENLGNKQAAVDYYQKEIKAIEKHPSSNGMIRGGYIQANIDRLKLGTTQP